MSNQATSGEYVPNGSDITAKQALQRMLELIRGSKDIGDITPEYMHKTMGVEIKTVDKDEYGYGQRLAGNWAWNIQHQQIDSVGPRVDFAFGAMPGTQASPADICEPDFAHFTGELEGMGFSRHSSRGEHNRWTYDYFERPGLRVEVYPITAMTDSGEPAGPTCVKMILVR